MLRPHLLFREKGALRRRARSCIGLTGKPLRKQQQQQQQQQVLLLLLLLLLGQFVLQQQLADPAAGAAAAAAERQGFPACSTLAWLPSGPHQLFKRNNSSRHSTPTAAAAAAAPAGAAPAAATPAAAAATIRPLHAAERDVATVTGENTSSLLPHEQLNQQDTQQQQQQQEQEQQQQEEQRQRGPAAGVSNKLRRFLRICLLGRPNVGKSSLFNRLILGDPRGATRAGPRGGGPRGESGRFGGALVGPTPGTTRDLLISTLVWKDRKIEFVDTGGIVAEKEEGEGGGPLASEGFALVGCLSCLVCV
ncbi:hypothetical protein ACSSS7_003797 [Eimeria intestinalis]